jgi:SAM-dependent methyltransferase
MSLGSAIMKLLRHPVAEGGFDVEDASCRIAVHRHLLESKRMLREGCIHWYRELLPAHLETQHLSGDIVEVGCGHGFLDEFIPGLIKTDSVPNPFAHKILDAMRMEYPDASLRAVVAVAVVHHLPHPGRFLSEAQRCLQRGGRLALVEPSNHYPVAGFPRRLFTILDHYEYFDDSIRDWSNACAGNMRGANLALPWVIFERDRAEFERRFPSLRIKHIRYHSLFSHVLGGGYSLRSIVPATAVSSVFALERALTPFVPKLGAMMTIDIEKV